MLRFVVVHRDEKHLVAADAHAVDLRLGLFAGLRRRLIGVAGLRLGRLLRFCHTQILA